MSTSEAAVDRGNVVEDDCPLCLELEPLPPFWDADLRMAFICCAKHVCSDCFDNQDEFLDRAVAEGSYGKQEHQLNRFCPLCRTKIPTSSVCFSLEMMDKFEEGRLPLNFYRKLGFSYIDGYGGVEIDVEKGMEILMLGAEKGDTHCQHMLGNCYDEGLYDNLVCQNLPKMQSGGGWQRPNRATQLPNTILQSCSETRETYRVLAIPEGVGVKRIQRGVLQPGPSLLQWRTYGLRPSSEEVIRVLTPAAERGDAESMPLLGTIACCPDPQLPPPLPWDNPNFTKGVQLYRRAAEKGDKKSILNLESMERNVSSKCFKCYTEAPPENAFLRCSRCRAAWYCSKDCQRRHWKAKEGGHKQFCIKWG